MSFFKRTGDRPRLSLVIDSDSSDLRIDPSPRLSASPRSALEGGRLPAHTKIPDDVREDVRHAVQMSVGQSEANCGLFVQLDELNTVHELNTFISSARDVLSELCLLELQLRVVGRIGHQSWMTPLSLIKARPKMLTALERLKRKLSAATAMNKMAFEANERRLAR